jgi:hypothetical protein
MLVGISGKSAGDFTKYESKCDLFNDGWKLFRPEAYDLLLMEQKADGTSVQVEGNDILWSDCAKDDSDDNSIQDGQSSQDNNVD